MKHFTLPVSPATVHWGYFSKKVSPALTLRSGDRATIETLTHHANDDHERMIAGDPGADGHQPRCHDGADVHGRRLDRRRSRTHAGSSRRAAARTSIPV